MMAPDGGSLDRAIRLDSVAPRSSAVTLASVECPTDEAEWVTSSLHSAPALSANGSAMAPAYAMPDAALGFT